MRLYTLQYETIFLGERILFNADLLYSVAAAHIASNTLISEFRPYRNGVCTQSSLEFPNVILLYIQNLQYLIAADVKTEKSRKKMRKI